MKRTIALVLLAVSLEGRTQYLSNLQATKNDALFTTYAAPLSRSSYKTDQGYTFQFNDPEKGIELISADGPNFGLAFGQGNEFRFRLKELFKEPIITTSYSDIFKYYYLPFENIRVEVCFGVYSSGSAFMEVVVKNVGKIVQEVVITPYIYYPSADSAVNIGHDNLFGGYYFPLYKKPDSWMKEHNIPLTTSLAGYFQYGIDLDSLCSSSSRAGAKPVKPTSVTDDIRRSIILRNSGPGHWVLAAGFRTTRLQAGESLNFRIILGLEDSSLRRPEAFRKLQALAGIDPESIIKEDERIYSRIPQIKISSKDHEMLYWSCFSLLRQCMMPPEGKCHYNYYVFSREPKWGWGYGGQVFHESLSMLAYVYMDPISAMNSQRVFMERQQADGYINYRTGPYLDETIPYSNQLTCSAPWFNYINLEVFKASKDRKFLQDAYKSGKKLYNWFVRNRDADRNGLCEWGAEGELESVRDARVAVWDQVSRPMNFEGPDLNSMLVMEARSLSEMAVLLGNRKEADSWDNLAKQRAALIEHYMWDSITHFYYNISTLNHNFTFRAKDDLKIKEIIGFLPLWAGVSRKTIADQLVKTLFDPREFWRPFGVPTLTAKSDYYNPIGYWNGPVWVQWDYLVYKGLKDYGYTSQASVLMSRVLDNMIWHLKHDHVFWEFYSPDERQAGWNKTYIWAGIAARMLMEEIY